ECVAAPFAVKYVDVIKCGSLDNRCKRGHAYGRLVSIRGMKYVCVSGAVENVLACGQIVSAWERTTAWSRRRRWPKGIGQRGASGYVDALWHFEVLPSRRHKALGNRCLCGRNPAGRRLECG